MCNPVDTAQSSSVTAENLSAKGCADESPPFPKGPKQPSDTLALILFAKFMLPDSQNSPTAPAQFPIHQTIPGLVPGEFLPPEVAIGDRLGRMERADMPEAPVHKHGHSLSAKDEVGATEKWKPPSPPFD